MPFVTPSARSRFALVKTSVALHKQAGKSMLDSACGKPSSATDVAVVGAGPYGLSIAAHLRAAGVSFRIFGHPMESWMSHMPSDMLLKSAGFATNLSDPERKLTLAQFCGEQGIPYSDAVIPVRRETFAAYGVSFQERLVPEVERRTLIALDRTTSEFLLRFGDGELVAAKRVVIAVGTKSFAYVPPELTHLPPEYLSHSSSHTDLRSFKGRRVAVIGGGASAIELVHLLYEAGATTQLVARSPFLRFLNTPSDQSRSIQQRILKPMTGMGPGWRAYFYANAPHVFRLLPQSVRHNVLSTFLPAEGGWFSKRQCDRLPLLLGHSLGRAEIMGDEVQLQLSGPNALPTSVRIDHVIAATGYRVDVAKLNFLSPLIRARLKLTDQAPTLSQRFESTVPGLHFVGLSSAHSFGPMFRFVLGTTFTARRLAKVFQGSRPRAALSPTSLLRPAKGATL